MYNTADPKMGYNMGTGFNDNSKADDYRKMQPNEDYDNESQVKFDDELSNEDIENFLKEL